MNTSRNWVRGHELGCHPYFKACQRNSGASQGALGLPAMEHLCPEYSRQPSSFLRLSLVKGAWAQPHPPRPFFDWYFQSASTHPKVCTVALLATTSTLLPLSCSSSSLSWRRGPPVRLVVNGSGTLSLPFGGQSVAKHMAGS